MKGESDEKIIKVFIGLRTKACSYLTDDNNESKKPKGKKIVIKKLTFEDYKKILEATNLENKISYLEKNKPDLKILI